MLALITLIAAAVFAGASLASWPFVLIVVMPVNRRLRH